MPATASNTLSQALGRLSRGERLGEALVTRAFAELMAGRATASQAAGLLMGLRVQGETGEELAGVARAMRDAMQVVETPQAGSAIDTAGTGGGAVGTFNVSTAAALVVAGAGVPVAKHGNRSYTSKCGSADVLEALGVGLIVEPGQAARVLAAAGMVFLFAPAFHPAMRHVVPIRRELGVTTVMNLVGPLANPARVRRQVIGVGDADRAPVVADALRRLGADRALVVHGVVGMDEISPVGPTRIWEVEQGTVSAWELDPEDYALAANEPARLRGGDPAANAARITRLFEAPDRDPAGRAAVLLNAGAALYVSGMATLKQGVERATAALHDGRAADALAALRRESPASTAG